MHVLELELELGYFKELPDGCVRRLKFPKDKVVSIFIPFPIRCCSIPRTERQKVVRVVECRSRKKVCRKCLMCVSAWIVPVVCALLLLLPFEKVP